MSIRAIVMIVVMALTAIFVAANWTVMTTPTDLSLIFATVYAPVGVVLLGLLGLVVVLFVGFMLYQQSAVLKETRQHAKEMSAQRELADKAEASRFTELKQFLSDELTRMHEHVETTAQVVQSRVDRLEIGLRETSPDDELKHLAELSERHAMDIQSRVDRLEIGLREMQSDAVPSPAKPPVLTATQVLESAAPSTKPAATGSALDLNSLRF